MGASWLPQVRTSLPLVDVRSPSFLGLLGLRGSTGYKVCRLCTLSLSLSLSRKESFTPVVPGLLPLPRAAVLASKSWVPLPSRRQDLVSLSFGLSAPRSCGSRFKSPPFRMSSMHNFSQSSKFKPIYLLVTRSARVSYSRFVFRAAELNGPFLNFLSVIANSQKSPR